MEYCVRDGTIKMDQTPETGILFFLEEPAADGDCCTGPLRDLPRLHVAIAWMNAKSADFFFIITYISDPLASMDCWLDFMRYLSFAMSLTRCLHSSLEKAFIWSQPPWMILFQPILCKASAEAGRREPPLVEGASRCAS